ncbi:hypothetical protein [Belnapia rosea]|uniref:hypothetical protein n=1 Tax=Belnapia rosea TaxID=938405 RepID=UPI00088EAC4D|nr:hypothetical protein [Belnapia rosea]SDB74376.1 hypothetical protein SAMN02927895_05177 [Belnapia rosea]
MAGVEWTYAILRKAIAPCQKHWVDPVTQYPVMMTPANQLVGAHAAVKNYRKAYPEDYGRIVGKSGKTERLAWESHHIVEGQDLKFLRSMGVDIPDYEVCPAVLIPPEAHRNRVSRTLPRGKDRLLADLDSYAEAYNHIGNYCGGGSKAIKEELMSICRAIIIV